jgi:hypothetical protein
MCSLVLMGQFFCWVFPMHSPFTAPDANPRR